MRILSLEGHYFVESLREMGHVVLTAGVGPFYDIPLTRPILLHELRQFMLDRGFWPEAVLWGDACRPPCVIGLERLPAPLIGYSVDQYMNGWHIPYSAAFDHFFVAQKDYLPFFERPNLARGVEWLPLFAPNGPEPAETAPDEANPPERDIPVGFVGTLRGAVNRERADFLRRFKAEHPLVVVQGPWPPVYYRSRLVLNQSAAGEVNLRLFEASLCGAAVLTEDVDNGLRELFTPDEEIFLYPRGDATAAGRIAAAVLADPARLAAVAKAGQARTRQDHLARIRTRTILRRIRELSAGQAWRRRQENMAEVERETANAYVFLGTDQTLRLSPELAAFYAELGVRYQQNGRA